LACSQTLSDSRGDRQTGPP